MYHFWILCTIYRIYKDYGRSIDSVRCDLGLLMLKLRIVNLKHINKHSLSANPNLNVGQQQLNSNILA